MERSSSSRSGSRSRRSYPSLNQISLTPLTPRYPIDDDDGDDGDNGNGHVNDDDQSQGYYSARSTSPDHPYSAGASTPRTRTPASYLSSFSVPGTPGLLSQSHSRSASRTRARHGRTKSNGNTGSGTPSGRRTSGHHHHHSHHQSSGSTGGGRSGRPDSEWMLRTGIALAESAREEKGQSWLVKRQSSTSLASDANNNGNNNNYESTGTTTRALSQRRSSRSRPSSSGMSTPRRGSRRSSRPDLSMTMTGLEMTSHTRMATPPSASDDQSRGFRPDAVDARIRAEMALIQQQQQQEEDRDIDKDGACSGADDDDYDNFDDDDDDGWSLDSADEIDEKEMQRLTRERGFGLGSWLDRMVEWTLFGVDEWPSLAASAENPPATAVEDTVGTPHLRDQAKKASTTGGPDDDGCTLAGDTEDNSSLSDNDDESSVNLVEKPGEKGGWEDARWLLHAVRRALFP